MLQNAQMGAGVPVFVAPGVRRILAPNPSAMTGPGTNTYLLGTSGVAVVDPGPDDPAHLAAILGAAGSAPITHILITHAHRDHSALAPALSRATNAPILAFGPPEAGRTTVMRSLAANGLSGGGEGLDTGFKPDATLVDGQKLCRADWSVTTLHTPGHFAGHLSFVVPTGDGRVAITGDTVLGWTSTLISPPDGDLGAFMVTCRMLRDQSFTQLLPGHGETITHPTKRLSWLIAHRKTREHQVLAALSQRPARAADLVAQIYTDIAPALHPMATRNVLAHLIDLYERNLVSATPHLAADAVFTLC